MQIIRFQFFFIKNQNMLVTLKRSEQLLQYLIKK